MKMPQAPATPAESDIPSLWDPSKTLKMLTHLNEFLCNPSWDEGTPKGERSLMTFLRVQSVTLIVKVERPALKLVVSGATLDEALAGIEAALMLPRCPWQHDDNPLGRVKGKKK
ncbi:hypothetical protein [Clostridium diolis]|uniref:hypothetical protein n=1 Tax=Clostridium diolis TaxID=223919 RepID=UPI0011B247F3|nr:hypothetical protein [Clostridium diolis]